MDPERDATSDPGWARRLLLFCETCPAREPCLHLSAVATRKRLVLFVPHSRAWRAGVSLDVAPANRKRSVCSRGCFHRYAGPDPRVYELLRVSIFVRRRSLAVLGQPLSDQFGGRDRRQAASYKSNRALCRSRYSDLRSGITDLAPMSGLSKCGDPLATYAAAEPRLLARPSQPGCCLTGPKSFLRGGNTLPISSATAASPL